MSSIFACGLQLHRKTETAKRAFADRAGSGKPAFLHVLFLENEKQNSRKNYRAMFSVKSKVTCKNLAHLEAKKQPKKSLMLFIQVPLQLE